ncbi:transcriptional regulator [Streptomyces sp. NPDC017941]|uniref:helix-turn-helix transcriptional regulator n=1 Tax=unclassified Streptomyces TaxID=2593676 RepID=UPI003790B9C8
MNPADHQPAPGHEIARLLDDVDAYAARLGTSRARLLDVGLISHTTGIEPERVRGLLAGEPPEEEPREKNARELFRKALFKERLRFLQRTRLKETFAGREPYGLREISRATGISAQHVSNLLNGERGANHDHAARLEVFFRVPEGFCSRTEGAALIAYLRRMVNEDLPKLATRAVLQELGACSVALRGTADGAQIDTLRDLLPALDELVKVIQGKHSGGASEAGRERP